MHDILSTSAYLNDQHIGASYRREIYCTERKKKQEQEEEILLLCLCPHLYLLVQNPHLTTIFLKLLLNLEFFKAIKASYHKQIFKWNNLFTDAWHAFWIKD